jgi:hypothetical protein
MMKKIIACLFILLTITSCDVVKQVQQAANFVNCNFSLKDIQDIRLAGISVQNKKGAADLNIGEAAQLGASLLGRTFPLTFNLNVEAKNPNKLAAGLNRIEWILFIDDIEMVRGSNEETINIPANESTVFPLKMEVDLKKVLTGKSGQALLNFGLNLAGKNGEPTRIKLKAKPSIMVGNHLIAYPGYITITEAIK